MHEFPGAAFDAWLTDNTEAYTNEPHEEEEPELRPGDTDWLDPCPICGHEEFVFLGALGTTCYYTCRACGMSVSETH